jgi:hypothetical protein
MVPVPDHEPGKAAKGPSAGRCAKLWDAKSESKTANAACLRTRARPRVDFGDATFMLYPLAIVKTDA